MDQEHATALEPNNQILAASLHRSDALTDERYAATPDDALRWGSAAEVTRAAPVTLVANTSAHAPASVSTSDRSIVIGNVPTLVFSDISFSLGAEGAQPAAQRQFQIASAQTLDARLPAVDGKAGESVSSAHLESVLLDGLDVGQEVGATPGFRACCKQD